jgi:hypothetical protein
MSVYSYSKECYWYEISSVVNKYDWKSKDLTIKSILFNMQARSKINSEEKEEFR